MTDMKRIYLINKAITSLTSAIVDLKKADSDSMGHPMLATIAINLDRMIEQLAEEHRDIS
jgi:hypothetical protein